MSNDIKIDGVNVDRDDLVRQLAEQGYDVSIERKAGLIGAVLRYGAIDFKVQAESLPRRTDVVKFMIDDGRGLFGNYAVMTSRKLNDTIAELVKIRQEMGWAE